MKIKNITAGLTDVLYPRRCPLCDGILGRQEPYICRSCAEKVSFVHGPVCMKCGRPLQDMQKETCAACRRREPAFRRNIAPFVYADNIQASLMRFKYGKRAEYARFYAASACLFAERMEIPLSGHSPEKLSFDAIVPVPIHADRFRKRGYNQAEEFARELSRHTGIPVRTDLVIRAKKTKPQKGLSGSERRKNLSGAFKVAEDAEIPDKILLTDDIYTTGTTLSELTSVILSASPQTIVSCICISVAAGPS